jgi:hypothetical protein
VGSGLVIDDIVPSRWRAPGRAYDFVVMGLGVWFLVSHGGWLPWTTFVAANLASLWLFDNKLFPHEIPLTRPWFAPLTFLVIGSLTLWPFLLVIEDDAARARGLAGLVIFLGMRLLFPLRPRE